MSALPDLIRGAAEPLIGSPSDYDSLLERVGDARFVLLGEASHGTHEFYRERAQISKRLIVERGFSAVAVEVGRRKRPPWMLRWSRSPRNAGIFRHGKTRSLCKPCAKRNAIAATFIDAAGDMTSRILGSRDSHVPRRYLPECHA